METSINWQRSGIWNTTNQFRSCYTHNQATSASFVFSCEMSRSTQSTLLSPEPSQWKPAEILNLRQKLNGIFYCSGVTNGSETPCGWKLNKQTASTINNLLKNMSKIPPQDAIQSLNDLAAITLCENHKIQELVKVTEWTEAIRHIQSTPAEPNISELDGSSPRPATTPRSISSLPPYSNISVGPVYSDDRFRASKESISAAQPSYVPLQKLIGELQEELKRQTAGFLRLEATCKEFKNANTSQKRWGWSWARLKARFRS